MTDFRPSLSLSLPLSSPQGDFSLRLLLKEGEVLSEHALSIDSPPICGDLGKKGQEPKQQQQQPANVTRGPKTMTGKEEERSTAAASAASAAVGDTLYLCNFRVSVDGDWLCLKELGGSDMDLAGSSAARPLTPHGLAQITMYWEMM